MNSVSVGIVGAGVIAQQVHLPVLLSMPQVQPAWLMDAVDARAREVARAYRVPHAPRPSSLSDLPHADVVLLAIPPGVRGPYYELLSRRGAAVFAEKPFAFSSAEHRGVLELFPPHRIGCGYQRRFFASSLLIKKILAADWFGRLRAIRITEGGRTTKTNVDSTHLDDLGASGGGILMSLGVHALDLVLQLTQSTAYSVVESRMLLDGGIDRKAEGTVLLHETNKRDGRQIELSYCFSALDYQTNTVEWEFPRCCVVTGSAPGSRVMLRGLDACGTPALIDGQEGGARTVNQAFYLEWASFLHGLESGQASNVAASTALLTTALVEELYQERGPL